MDEVKILEEMLRLHRAGIPAVLATVVESAGSSPRKAGAKMLVRRDGSILGTVGGGRVELETIEAALAALAASLPRTVAFTLTEENGYACGGKMLIFIEPLSVEPRLVIIGAGHVGLALAAAAALAGFRVSLADERPGRAETVPTAAGVETFTGDAAGALVHFPVDRATSIVIATPGHEKDFEAVRAALKTPAGYIGVVGSRKKREVLRRLLSGEGYAPREIDRVIMPVGLEIGAETPAEIAASVVAQLILARRKQAHGRSSDSPCGGSVAADGQLEAAPAAG